MGSAGDSGGLPSVTGTRPSSPTGHSASSPLVESDEMQSGTDMESTATDCEATESVRSPSPQKQEEEAASNICIKSIFGRGSAPR